MEEASQSGGPRQSLESQLLAALPDPVWARDLQGRYLFCNPAFERLFGVDSKSLLDTDGAETGSALLAELERFRLGRCDGDPGERRFDWRSETVSGANACVLDIRERPLFDSAGVCEALLWVARESSPHAQVDADWNTETRFHQLFEQIEAISVQGYDRNRRVLYWNPASEALYGYRRDEALGSRLEDLIIPDPMRAAVVAGVDAWVAGGPGVPAGELTLCRADGSPVHVFSSHVMLKGPDGQPQMYCVDIDLSERQRAEEEIRRLSLVIEQSPESILITDLDGRIEYVNEALVHSSGYSREELIGRTPGILQSGCTHEETYRELWSNLTHGREWRGQLINRRKNGEHYPEMVLITPLRQSDGRITNYVALKEDISEKQRAIEELERYRNHLEDLVSERTAQLSEARERAERASRAKSVFLANMSHEIRSPMNAILGLTYLLKREIQRPKQAETLGKIEDAANHLLAVINDILDISKIEAGKLSLRTHDFVVAELFGQVESVVLGILSDKGLGFDRDLDPDLPQVLHGDSTRLRQALLNYLGNAAKFTEAGRIRLSVRVLERGDREVLVRFEVTDTGGGISSEAMSRLFQPFVQVENPATPDSSSGTGLGLVITRRLAGLMGGDAGAESEPGKGSRFWFTARLGTQVEEGVSRPRFERNADDAERRLAESHRGARILVAEDSAINQEVVKGMLDAVGLETDLADNGRIAVEMAGRARYDLILMDIQMPVLDGIAASRLLLESPNWSPCPILAMTANAFEEDRLRCLEAGMVDHVPKPVHPARFYVTLKRWLDTQGHRAAEADAAVSGAGEIRPESDWVSLKYLRSIPGLDLEYALASFQGDLGFYRAIVAQFVAHHGDDLLSIKQARSSGDLFEARRILHRLKGVSGSLGLVRLRDLAAELESGWREGLDEERLEARLAELESVHEDLVIALKSLPGH